MNITKSIVESFLQDQLLISEKKIALLNQLKLENRPAKSSETTVIGRIQRTNSGIIALALEHEHHMHKSIGIDYQPFLLESNEQKDLFADFLAGMPKEKAYRFNFIIGGRGLHATPVTICSDGNEVNIFSLDAALYYDNFNCIDLFALATNAKTYKYTGGGIQNGAFGCSIYSIGHLREMAKMNVDELKEMFNNAMSRKNDQYLGFRPEFITNMQSTSGMEIYLLSNPEASIIKESKEQNTQKIFDNTSIKLRNYAITYQNHQVLSNALEMLKNITEEEFQNIFERRTGKQALEQAYEELSPSQISQVTGIYNLDKIKLILDGICSYEQVSGSNIRCFSPRQDDSKYVADILQYGEHIQYPTGIESISGPQLELLSNNREISCAEIFIRPLAEGWQGKQYLFDLQVLEAYKRGTKFEQIQNCTNAYEIEAISKYNIEPDLANNAICFQDPNNQAIAISFIRRAYNEAEEGKKESLAKAVFFRIKDNPCNNNAQISTLYKETLKVCPSPLSIASLFQEQINAERKKTSSISLIDF